MGIIVEHARIYRERSRHNPGSVDQPWITRSNAGLLQVKTLDQARIIPWITGDLARGRAGHILPRTFDKLVWRAIVSNHGHDSCTTRGSERLSKRVNRWLSGQIEYSVKMGRGGHAERVSYP
jgi:hypothetical protein